MTRILGFRADPSRARYAIIEHDGANFKFVNRATENRLVFPANLDQAPEKILWLYREIKRIFHADPDIERVVIKTNEFVMRETAAKRLSSYIEAGVMLYCEENKIPVGTKTYASLGTGSASAKEEAEQRVGKTAKYWDSKIADAILVACWGAEHR
jgi:hypothetical protein